MLNVRFEAVIRTCFASNIALQLPEYYTERIDDSAISNVIFIIRKNVIIKKERQTFQDEIDPLRTHRPFSTKLSEVHAFSASSHLYKFQLDLPYRCFTEGLGYLRVFYTRGGKLHSVDFHYYV